MLAHAVDEICVPEFLRGLKRPVDIRDANGVLLGTYTPADAVEVEPFDIEAIKKRPRRPGISTAELLTRLRALGPES